MKIRCECNHVISDQTDDLPYKCWLLPDEGSHERMVEPIVRGILDFAAAMAAGDREGWLSRHFGEGYPRDLDDDSVISDFVEGRVFRSGVATYQCTECGAILIRRRDGQGYAGFSPMDDRELWQDILSRRA